MTCTHTSTVVSGKIHTPIHGHGVSSMCKIAHPTSPVVIQNRSRVIEMKCGFFLHKILKFVQPIPGRFPMAVWLTRFSFPFFGWKAFICVRELCTGSTECTRCLWCLDCTGPAWIPAGLGNPALCSAPGSSARSLHLEVVRGRRVLSFLDISCILCRFHQVARRKRALADQGATKD